MSDLDNQIEAAGVELENSYTAFLGRYSYYVGMMRFSFFIYIAIIAIFIFVSMYVSVCTMFCDGTHPNYSYFILHLTPVFGILLLLGTVNPKIYTLSPEYVREAASIFAIQRGFLLDTIYHGMQFVLCLAMFNIATDYDTQMLVLHGVAFVAGYYIFDGWLSSRFLNTVSVYKYLVYSQLEGRVMATDGANNE